MGLNNCAISPSPYVGHTVFGTDFLVVSPVMGTHVWLEMLRFGTMGPVFMSETDQWGFNKLHIL